jgi:riboflavin kinase/FMN adenylyltransferase
MMPWLLTFPTALPLPAGCVVTMGNFDGVHAGHRHLVQQALAHSQTLQIPLIALTFHPHPRTVLRATEAFQQLQTLPERTTALQNLGVRGVAVVPFDTHRAQQSPTAFMHEILQEWLNAKVVVVGENFRFGHRAQGTPLTLQANPAFQTVVAPLAGDAGGPYSSSRLRATAKPVGEP